MNYVEIGEVEMKYKYTVVRSYLNDCSELERALSNDWEFVRASEFITIVDDKGYEKRGYIEYILRKPLTN